MPIEPISNTGQTTALPQGGAGLPPENNQPPAQQPASGGQVDSNPQPSAADQNSARDAGEKAKSDFAKALDTEAERKKSAETISGRKYEDLSADEINKYNSIFDSIQNGTYKGPDFVSAAQSTTTEAPSALGRNVLPSQIAGGFTTAGGPGGTALLSNNLDQDTLYRVAREEFGESVAARAQQLGLNVAEGDVGRRLQRVVDGETVTPETDPWAFVDTTGVQDTYFARVDGNVQAVKGFTRTAGEWDIRNRLLDSEAYALPGAGIVGRAGAGTTPRSKFWSQFSPVLENVSSNFDKIQAKQTELYWNELKKAPDGTGLAEYYKLNTILSAYKEGKTNLKIDETKVEADIHASLKANAAELDRIYKQSVDGALSSVMGSGSAVSWANSLYDEFTSTAVQDYYTKNIITGSAGQEAKELALEHMNATIQLIAHFDPAAGARAIAYVGNSFAANTPLASSAEMADAVAAPEAKIDVLSTVFGLSDRFMNAATLVAVGRQRQAAYVATEAGKRAVALGEAPEIAQYDQLFAQSEALQANSAMLKTYLATGTAEEGTSEYHEVRSIIQNYIDELDVHDLSAQTTKTSKAFGELAELEKSIPKLKGISTAFQNVANHIGALADITSIVSSIYSTTTGHTLEGTNATRTATGLSLGSAWAGLLGQAPLLAKTAGNYSAAINSAVISDLGVAAANTLRWLNPIGAALATGASIADAVQAHQDGNNARVASDLITAAGSATTAVGLALAYAWPAVVAFPYLAAAGGVIAIASTVSYAILDHFKQYETKADNDNFIRKYGSQYIVP